MEIRDITAQLRSLEVEISESFLVHFILNSFPPKYGLFKMSYNTHKEKWSINELLIVFVQEEESVDTYLHPVSDLEGQCGVGPAERVAVLE